MADEKKLLDEVKDTLDAITALKSGKPTQTPEEEADQSAEETTKDESVEETKDEQSNTSEEEQVTKDADEATEEVKSDEEKGDEETKADEEKAEESTEEDKADEEASKEASAKAEVTVKIADMDEFKQVLGAISEIANHVKTLAEDVEALKSAKSSRKGVMPEGEKEAEEDESEAGAEDAKIQKQVDYIFGK